MVHQGSRRLSLTSVNCASQWFRLGIDVGARILPTTRNTLRRYAWHAVKLPFRGLS